MNGAELGPLLTMFMERTNQSRSVLFDLPEVASAIICSTWLSVESIRDLDLACCSHAYRWKLLNIFNFDGFKVSIPQNLPQDATKYFNFISWIHSRGLTIDRISIPSKNVKDGTRIHFEIAQLFNNRTTRRLKSISISAMKLNEIMLILCSSSKIERLVLKDIQFPSKRKFPQSNYHSIEVESCPQLSSLQFYNCKSISGSFIGTLNVGKLRALSILNCDTISKSCCESLATRLTDHFEELHLKNISKLTDSRLARLLRGCKQLKTLSIEYSDELTGDTYESIGKNCPHLSSFVVRMLDPDYYVAYDIELSSLHDAGFCKLALNCMYMRSLVLDGTIHISDDSLRAILQNMNTLQILCLLRCHNLRGEGVVIPKYATVSSLEHLYIYHCDNLTGIMNICEICPFLNKLEIFDCSLFNFAAFTHIFKYGTKLSHLCISNANNVYGHDLDVVTPGNLPALEVLLLDMCNGLTDEGLHHILQICPNIQQLNLQQCTALTNASLHAISNNCSALQHLGIVECKELSQTALLPVLQRCSQLRALQLQWSNTPPYLNINAYTLLSIAAIPDLRLEAIYIHGFIPTGKNFQALAKLLDDCPTLVKVYLEGDGLTTSIVSAGVERRDSIASEREHLSAYVSFLQRLYPQRSILVPQLFFIEHFCDFYPLRRREKASCVRHYTETCQTI